MEKSIITTGKTIDLAVAAALEQLQMDRDSVSVEVLENPRSGFLGIGAQPAKIKVTYDDPTEEAPKAALSSASRNMPKKRFPVQETPVAPVAPVTPAAPAVKAEPQQPRTERPRREERQEKTERPRREERQPRTERPRREEKPEQPVEAALQTEQAAPERPKRELPEYKTPEAGSVEERCETFIKGLLEHMGSNAVPKAYRMDEDTVLCDLTGENLGMLIGRRGDTLDAIQHLTNYAVNQGSGKRVRINVDAENYRAKREESLERLARKVASKVAKYRRSVTLEPMNAYERHVIHAALQDYRNISTHSTGTEPNRRVVVSYERK